MKTAKGTVVPNRQIESFLHALAFILPYLIINLVFLTYPFIKGIWMSFHNWDLLKPRPTFIGASNYSRLFKDPSFWTSLIHTLEFTGMTVPLVTVIGLGLALL